jgi:prefoldin subunit 5
MADIDPAIAVLQRQLDNYKANKTQLDEECARLHRHAALCSEQAAQLEAAIASTEKAIKTLQKNP